MLGPFGFKDAPRIETLEEFVAKLKNASTSLEKRGLLLYLRHNPNFRYGQGLDEKTPRKVWEERERKYRTDYLRFMLEVCDEAIAEEEPDEDVLEPAVYCLLQGCWIYRLDHAEVHEQSPLIIDEPELYVKVVDFLAREELHRLHFVQEETGKYIRWSSWLFFRSKPWNMRSRNAKTWQVEGHRSYVPESWFDAIIRSHNVDLFWDAEFAEEWETHGKIALAKLATAIRESEEPVLYMLALVKILKRNRQLRDFLASLKGSDEEGSTSRVYFVGCDNPFESLGVGEY